MEPEDPVIEWEITAHETDSGNYIVGQAVLKDEFRDSPEFVIENLCQKYKLDSVKIYEKFESSEVTGKRDYQLLKDDKEGYYTFYNGALREISYSNNIRTVI
ncbi:MAG: hypothetical protein IKQ25_12380 [Lachnospiraceae bacterium]|nr:hypothetical protein [Lachnospiraceae bacterium]